MEDSDDWDVTDKTFSWLEDDRLMKKDRFFERNFYIDYSTGTVFAKRPIKGMHQLKFQVFDRVHQQTVHSTMNIEMIDIPLAAIINSGSIRIIGMDSFQFIRTWDWHSRQTIISFKERLEQSLKRLLNCDSLNIISIIDRPNQLTAQQTSPHTIIHNEKIIDVRYFAKLKNRFLSSVYINSLVQLNVDRIERETTVSLLVS